MKNILRRIWKLICAFPLTTYGIFGFFILIIAEVQSDYSEAITISILFLPVFFLYAKIYDFFPINTNISNIQEVLTTYPLVLIFLILADLLFFYIHTKIFQKSGSHKL